ncbi:ABC transporter ATP-binding protein [Rhodococcus tibetensis]|uniref:ABC transporter ATP-binding protein n=1 Tax=Rhodococcus tibetensis TaxID=2965064 RepID=A0ABT1Q8G4_9NOCA|nr:ABC transporter ATP-binding protein [Rhodococcus sp. FXJ9.536]MCQ4118531.1 ABC transporter ATP-binding protein [Rhodococcus sp. FXJ9.536]
MTSRTPGSAQPAVRLEGVVKTFDGVRAVDNLDLIVEQAQVVALLGPNGAGKTTTVEMCEGFVRPDSGIVRVLGLDPIADAGKVRARIGVMLQGGGAYPGSRAGEMLDLVAAYSADPLDPDWLLRSLGLEESRRTPYRRLSGGQQQRLSLACALVGRPELVFLDEPTAGLDAQARLMVWELIDALRRDGVGVLLTTHVMNEAEELADQLVIIDHGSVVASGTPNEVTSRGAEGQLRLTAPPGLDTARLVLPDTFRVFESTPGTYLIEGPIDPVVVAAVASWCADLDALISDIRVDQRSLEDVFLELTGRELRG